MKKWWQEFIEIENGKAPLLLKFKYLKHSGLDIYEKNALLLLGVKKLGRVKENDLVAQMLPMSLKDWMQKDKKDLNYYRKNAYCFILVARILLSDEFLKAFKKCPKSRTLWSHNYYNLWNRLLFDAIILLQTYELRFQKKKTQFFLGRTPILHDIDFLITLRQSLYGQSSFHSSADRVPDVSILLIRQFMEVKVRRITGVLGIYNPATDSYEGLPASWLLGILKKYEKNMYLHIPINNLERIYQWSNIHTHSSMLSYLWHPIFITLYLTKFILAQEKQGRIPKHPSDKLIYMPQRVVKMIHSDLQRQLKQSKQFNRKKLLFW
jgi:hypothetical protein